MAESHQTMQDLQPLPCKDRTIYKFTLNTARVLLTVPSQLVDKIQPITIRQHVTFALVTKIATLLTCNTPVLIIYSPPTPLKKTKKN